MNPSETPPPRVPLVVLGGYLGAGKTTLINQILRGAAGRRIAVLVNDFGDVNIDAELIEGASNGVLALSGGCVCCSFGDDLLGGLRQVATRQPAPDVILLECSGVGLPGSVAQSAALCPAVMVEGIAVVLDASRIRALAQDRYVADTVLQQLRSADLLLVNQMDHCASKALPALLDWLGKLAPQAPCLPCTHGQVPADLVLGLHREPQGSASAQTSWLGKGPFAAGPAAARFRAYSYTCTEPMPPQDLADFLLGQDPLLLRAKGVIRDPQGVLWRLHMLGRRVQIEAETRQARDLSVLDQMLCIGICTQAGDACDPDLSPLLNNSPQ